MPGSSNGAVLGAAIQGGSGLLGGLINILGRKNAVKWQLKHDKAMADYQFNKNVAMWNMENKYNSPSAQMSRLKAAGLNPNMIYGSGSSAATGQAHELPQYSTIRSGNPFPDISLPNVMGAYYDMKVKAATADNIAANTANKRMETGMNFLKSQLMGWKIKSSSLNNTWQSKTLDARIKQSMAYADKVINEDKISAKQWSQFWSKGFNPNWPVRNFLGIGAGYGLKSMWDYFKSHSPAINGGVRFK